MRSSFLPSAVLGRLALVARGLQADHDEGDVRVVHLQSLERASVSRRCAGAEERGEGRGLPESLTSKWASVTSSLIAAPAGQSLSVSA